MVNNLVGYAYLRGEVLVKSDGTPWRPLVHVDDIASAFLAVLQAPREVVHDQAFNVGRTDENFRVSEVADMVRAAVPGSEVIYAEGGGPDPRCYRVNCDKLPRLVPEYRPRWTVEMGIRQLFERLQGRRTDRRGFPRLEVSAHQPHPQSALHQPTRRGSTVEMRRSVARLTQAIDGSASCNWGRRTCMVVPRPNSLSTSIDPPRTMTSRRTMCRPSPAPPKSRWIDASAC